MNLVANASARVRAWLAGQALPLWAAAGVDETGSFYEQLKFDGSPDRASPRRMRVQARQLYVFSEAAVRGWWAPARGVADAGFEALLRDCWAPDGKRGFLHTIGQDRAPLDMRRDAYDHAFGLFALAWYYKASGDPRALEMAHATLEVMQSLLADPVYGGFLESAPAVLPRRSDPHMHTLEACLEWHEVAGDERFRRVAARMVDLFKTRFFDAETGTLREYFAADLTPAAGAPGRAVFPGHHFEWTWLLNWAQARGAGAAKVEADTLYDYAIRYGLDHRGLAIDECDRHGRQIRPSRRAWPQTELIKAYLTKARQGVEGAAEAAAKTAVAVLDTYLATEIPGLWMDQYDELGRGMASAVPASTLYHFVVAFRELMVFAEEVQSGAKTPAMYALS